MHFLQRSANLIVYEVRRALAKKKIYVLLILAFALQIGIYTLFKYVFTNPPPEVTITGPPLEEFKGTMWLLGVLGGSQGLFIPIIAIIIAGGSMSEEYEHGTADILLSKPVTRIEYVTGKYLGGLLFLSLIIALITGLGVALAYGLFGPQDSLHLVPVVYMALVYANLLFFSLAFMFSEIIRSTTSAIMAAIGIFIGSIAVGSYLSVLYAMTQQQLYLNISRWLPYWTTSNFPSFVISELMTTPSSPFVSVQSGNLQLAATIIAVYTTASILIATFKLIRSDITKKPD